LIAEFVRIAAIIDSMIGAKESGLLFAAVFYQESQSAKARAVPQKFRIKHLP
jgi:hypothetical protein